MVATSLRHSKAAGRQIEQGCSGSYWRGAFSRPRIPWLMSAIIDDFPAFPLTNIVDRHRWRPEPGRSEDLRCPDNNKAVQRCMLMTTDPGDLVLDPTCGSGTTAFVAEQWGRRWITIDTSRVALALARQRIMGAKFPYYLLADSREGQLKEAELTGQHPTESAPTSGRCAEGVRLRTRSACQAEVDRTTIPTSSQA